ncbi:hypothetical protein HK102_010999, partial [Quaeritorhiza haematococci]
YQYPPPRRKKGSVTAVGSPIDLEVLFGMRDLLRIVYDVVVGNQVVVRGEPMELVRSVVLQLKVFIPSYCASVIEYSDVYEEPWKCNLLGLAAAAEIPDHIDESHVAVIDVMPNPSSDLDASAEEHVVIKTRLTPAASSIHAKQHAPQTLDSKGRGQQQQQQQALQLSLSHSPSHSPTPSPSSSFSSSSSAAARLFLGMRSMRNGKEGRSASPTPITDNVTVAMQTTGEGEGGGAGGEEAPSFVDRVGELLRRHRDPEVVMTHLIYLKEQWL